MTDKWLSIKEISKELGISNPAVRKRAKRENWDQKSVKPEKGGKDRVFYQMSADDDILPANVEAMPTLPDVLADTSFKEINTYQSQAGVPALAPSEQLPYKYEHIAKLRCRLCEIIAQELKKTKDKALAWQDMADLYNAGVLLPALFRTDGKKSERTLRRWHQTFVKSGNDYFALAPKFKHRAIKRNITQSEKDFILKELLKPQRIKPFSIIRKLKQLERAGLEKSPSAERTLYRWITDWAATHPQLFILERYGVKALAEKGLPSLLRDDSLINPTDVLVADGHVISCDIISPLTGKPKRMMMIVFLDWASRMPVGMSLASTENAQHILLAFRDACLNMGAKPKHIYIDNGRAFKAKLFHQKSDECDLKTELAGAFPRLKVDCSYFEPEKKQISTAMEGLYPRLGIGTTYAKAYNAKAKVVERFFKTFQEDFERFMDTFRGACIADKPAYLQRNEKRAKSKFWGKAMPYELAVAYIRYYFWEFYAKTPHRGLNKQTPYDVLKSYPIPDAQKIDPAKFNFLLLSRTIKKLNQNGIVLESIQYWDDEMVTYIGQRVNVRYEETNRQYVLVYDIHDKFICQALARKHTHPMVHLSANKLQDISLLRAEIKRFAQLQKQAVHAANELQKLLGPRTNTLELPANYVAGIDHNQQPLIAPPPDTVNFDKVYSAQVAEQAGTKEVEVDENPILSQALKDKLNKFGI